MNVIRIERISSRPGVIEEPLITPRGYKLGNPAFGERKHCKEAQVYVTTLDGAADLIDKGYPIWMHGRGKRASLISPASLRIIKK